jgi:hypothetical protein
VDLPILGLIDGFGFLLWRESASDEVRERAGAARITSITVWNSPSREEGTLRDGLEQVVHDSGADLIVRERQAAWMRV